MADKAPAFQFSLRTVEKFWRKVDGGRIDECWLWQAATDRENYGQFWQGDRQVRAHRYAYAYHHNLTTLDQQVLHRCDNPRCVNPAHLFLGSQKDNMHDRRAKGRGNHPSGLKHWNIRVTQEVADKILRMTADGHSQAMTAATLGLSPATVCRVMNGIKPAGIR